MKFSLFQTAEFHKFRICDNLCKPDLHFAMQQFQLQNQLINYKDYTQLACRICDTSSKLDLHFGNAVIGSLKFNLLLSKAALEKMRYKYTFKSQIKSATSKNKEK